jgi:formylglycine-generating enzyme required for sulfatase activity
MQRSGHPDNVFPWGATWPPPPNTGNFAGEEVLAPRAAGKYPWIKIVLKGYRDNFETASPVGNYTANRFGLYDMSGNVLQWCEDLYSDEELGWRVRRGSGYGDGSRYALLVSYRNGAKPSSRYGSTGFRAVIAPVAK